MKTKGKAFITISTLAVLMMVFSAILPAYAYYHNTTLYGINATFSRNETIYPYSELVTDDPNAYQHTWYCRLYRRVSFVGWELDDYIFQMTGDYVYDKHRGTSSFLWIDTDDAFVGPADPPYHIWCDDFEESLSVNCLNYCYSDAPDTYDLIEWYVDYYVEWYADDDKVATSGVSYTNHQEKPSYWDAYYYASCWPYNNCDCWPW